jgi:hypothetical protein
MAIKISKKIKGYAVVKTDEPAPAVPAPEREVYKGADVIQMHEAIERPEALEGSTYKIRSPLFDHALYVTINDIVLNLGTDFELRRPFEIFINSKNMEHFQWIVALTRIISAVFRKGGDVTFLVEELKAVFDPKGGYFLAGGSYMPSVVAEIGSVIEAHLKKIGMIVDENLSEAQLKLIKEKRAAYEERLKKNADAPIAPGGESSSGFPPGATLCPKCNTQAMIVMDGCETCLNCGHSKCG